jgi:hypothetical protein
MDVHQQLHEEWYKRGSCQDTTLSGAQGEIREKDRRQSLGDGQPIRDPWVDLGMGMMRSVDTGCDGRRGGQRRIRCCS